MKKPMQTIIPPIDGWKPHTFYLVELSVGKQNPLFLALFFSGFLYCGKPGSGYGRAMSMSNDAISLDEVYYMRVLRSVVDMEAESVRWRDTLLRLPDSLSEKDKAPVIRID